jgi:hypothetical protein
MDGWMDGCMDECATDIGIMKVKASTVGLKVKVLCCKNRTTTCLP